MLPHERKLLGMEEGATGGPSEYMPFSGQHGSGPSGGGYVPGDREAHGAARKWAQSVLKGTKASPKRKREWDEYGKRQLLTPAQIDAGWAHLTRMGEATSWWGYSVPNLGMVKTPQAPQAMQGPAAGFPFHTRTAEIVFRAATKLIPLHPEKTSIEILKLAVDETQSQPNELTPEDAKLLDIAIAWAQNGKAGVGFGNRIGGMPGGPFRSSTSTMGKGAP